MKIQVDPKKTNFPMPAVLISCQHEKKSNPFIYWMSGGEYWNIGSKVGSVKKDYYE